MTDDDVLRFRESVAKFDSENASKIHDVIGLTKRVGPIVGGFDNYDLVCTPNGDRETCAMALEFQQHPEAINETGSAKPGVINVTIPHFNKSTSGCLLSCHSVVMKYDTGPKVNPPAVVCTSGPPYIDIPCACCTPISRCYGRWPISRADQLLMSLTMGGRLWTALSLCSAAGATAPTNLEDVISCRCKACGNRGRSCRVVDHLACIFCQRNALLQPPLSRLKERIG